ncbi:transposase [Labrys sp. KB_33_2]|uniref:transposase n=1 Tax=Labrys sp. KB_33_2 TaxID=3237479 RepID=UPI003F91DFDB
MGSSVWGCRSKKALRAAEQDRPDVAARRKLWQAAQPFIDPDKLVFLDETGINTKMTRHYGWAPVGERCRDSAPFGHWKTMTFIAGLRQTGMTAPWVLEGPMDGDAFGLAGPIALDGIGRADRGLQGAVAVRRTVRELGYLSSGCAAFLGSYETFQV